MPSIFRELFLPKIPCDRVKTLMIDGDKGISAIIHSIAIRNHRLRWEISRASERRETHQELDASEDGFLQAAAMFARVHFPAAGRSGGSALVSMVKATNLGYGNDASELRRFNRSSVRRVLPKRQMAP